MNLTTDNIRSTPAATLLAAIVTTGLITTGAAGQPTVATETDLLVGADTAAGDGFGGAVDLEGDVAIVGALADDDLGASSGSAYIYVLDAGSGTWVQEQKLTASDGQAGEQFGFAVAIDGNIAIVGARLGIDGGVGSGTAYVYEYDAMMGAWVEQAKLVPSDAAGADNFGGSVALDGDVAVIGSRLDDDNGTRSGSAYIFRRNSMGIWDEEAKLTASDGSGDDRFGLGVKIDGDYVVATSVDNGARSGAAYVFERDAMGIWPEVAILTGSDTLAGDGFGATPSIEGGTLVVGAPLRAPGGAAYVFGRDAMGLWNEQAILTASDGAAGDQFGGGISLCGDQLVIGASRYDGVGTDSGAAYVFRRDVTTGTWIEDEKLVPSDSQAGDRFGTPIAACHSAIIGALLDDVGGRNSGSAYVFSVSLPSTVISVNFGISLNDANTVGSDESAVLTPGAANVGGDGWNNILLRATGYGIPTQFISDTQGGNALPLIDENGAVTAAQVTSSGSFYTTFTNISAPSQSATGEGGLMQSELSIGDPGGVQESITISGLNSALGGSQYEVFLFTDVRSERTARITVSDGLSTTSVWKQDALGLDSDSNDDGVIEWLEVTGTTEATRTVEGNYVHVTGLSGDAVTITVHEIMDARIGINGLQIIAVPEPPVTDTDGDGLDDVDEIALGTDPNVADTDGDTLSDGDEVNVYGTNPLTNDTDGDLLFDNEEINAQQFGCPDPLVADSDGDLLDDGTEWLLGLDPCDTDTDADGLADGLESTYGTDPLVSDTDGDGLNDGTEVDVAQGGSCPSPTDADSDGDTLSDGAESDLGTNPCDVDTDGDSIPDNLDPLPTDPGGTQDYLETELRDLAGTVADIPLTEFSGNSNATKGRRNATSSKLNAAAKQIANGDYQEAIDKLNGMLNKLDDEPSPPDWMNPGPDKDAVRQSIEDTIVVLSYLL